jgi:hypothetical protein
MTRKSLVDQKNWVVVLSNEVHHFIQFKEALQFNTSNGGSLMSKEYYETGYTQ